MKIVEASKRRNQLGEGPHWDASTGTLIYDDANAHQVLRYDPKTGAETEVFDLGDTVGNVILYAGKPREAVVCVGMNIVHLDMDTSKTSLLATVAPHTTEPPHRINDGKCDIKGRLWTGTMQRNWDLNSPLGLGNFYSFSQGSLKVHFGSVTLSNGIAWTADNRTMFYNDSVPGFTYAFDFDAEEGTLSNRRVVVDFKKTAGYESCGLPDGMTIDVNDKLWLVGFSGSCVVQIDPETSKILRKIDLPAKCTTSCCFGGATYEDLYVTSANLPGYSSCPEDGALFRITELGVKGKAPYEFAG
ncbi:regucalcin-like [Ornithodoros turicata]|uniref:regucalcin-like n=1 Tax=Ornithodoros turicata TaxID=34597 RepID=UPI003138EF7B